MPRFNVKDKIKADVNTYIELKVEMTQDLSRFKDNILKYNESLKVDNNIVFINKIAKKIKIENINDNILLLKFKGLNFFATEQINNTDNANIIGDFIYINYDSLKNYTPNDLNQKIIVIDYLTREMVYMAKALKAKAIFTNSIDLSTFNSIKTTDLPIQIFTGFGKILFDKNVKQLIVDHSKQMILDLNYQRMILSKHNLENTINFEVDF